MIDARVNDAISQHKQKVDWHKAEEEKIEKVETLHAMKTEGFVKATEGERSPTKGKGQKSWCVDVLDSNN